MIMLSFVGWGIGEIIYWVAMSGLWEDGKNYGGKGSPRVEGAA